MTTDPKADSQAVLKYTEAEVNQTFKIKVTGRNFVAPTLNEFVGIKRLVSLLGQALAYKLINKAMDSLDDLPIYKTRRGLTVKFYSDL